MAKGQQTTAKTFHFFPPHLWVPIGTGMKWRWKIGRENKKDAGRESQPSFIYLSPYGCYLFLSYTSKTVGQRIYSPVPNRPFVYPLLIGLGPYRSLQEPNNKPKGKVFSTCSYFLFTISCLPNRNRNSNRVRKESNFPLQE